MVLVIQLDFSFPLAHYIVIDYLIFIVPISPHELWSQVSVPVWRKRNCHSWHLVTQWWMTNINFNFVRERGEKWTCLKNVTNVLTNSVCAVSTLLNSVENRWSVTSALIPVWGPWQHILTWAPLLSLVLDMNLHEDSSFTNMENSPARAFSCFHI